jgi:AbrB family looped-hinge helix DNA binding protein
MLARLTSKGQVTIPKKIRVLLNVSYGDVIDFSIEKKKIFLRKQNSLTSARAIRGILKAKRRQTDKEINRARGLALSKKWPRQ